MSRVFISLPRQCKGWKERWGVRTQDEKMGMRLFVWRVSGESFPLCALGFVTSKKLGGAVVRNRIRRRLRHAMKEILCTFDVNSIVHREKIQEIVCYVLSVRCPSFSCTPYKDLLRYLQDRVYDVTSKFMRNDVKSLFERTKFFADREK